MREPAVIGVPFIDAHVHFWRLDRLDYDWLTPPFSNEGVNGDVSAIAHDYTPEDYAADTEGWPIAGCVHVEAGAAPAQAVDETRWLETLADETGWPSVVVAHADLTDPAIEDVLAAQTRFGRVRGIRQIVNHHPNPARTYLPADLTGSDAWRRGFARLGAHGLSFDLQAYPHQFAGLLPLFRRHEDVPVVLNHLGMAFPDEIDTWRLGMAALAALPQVSVKISGFGITHRGWTEARIRPLIREALDLFGPDRLLVASDAPTDKLHASVGDCLSAYASILGDLSADETRAVWGGNANRVYRIGPAS